MPKDRSALETCYYCGATVLPGSFQRDHFPIPERAGGTLTVPACMSCHDLKDRLRFDQWNPEMIADVMDDWPKLGRAARLMIAKFLAMHADYVEARREADASSARQAGRSRDGPMAGPDGG